MDKELGQCLRIYLLSGCSWLRITPAGSMPGRKSVLRVLGLVIVSLGLALVGTPRAHATGAGLSYHGRLIDPEGNAVVGTSVQFKVQIRSPGNEDCLFYEEVQIKDLSQNDGIFALTIKDGTGTRTDSTGFSLEQIFANRGSFTFPAGLCASGSTWSPNPSDGRKIQIAFNDGTFATGTWEQSPAVTINFVPMAIEAFQVGGYKKEQLLKVADGVTTTGTELNSASWTELLALIGGTTTQYVKSGSAIFTSAPQWSGVPSGANDLVNKTYVDSQVVAGLPDVGTAGTYAKVTTDSKGRVTSGGALVEADVPTLSTAGKVSGSAINAGTLGGSTAISTSGNLVTTGTVQGAIVSGTNIRAYNGANYVQLAAPALGGNVNFSLPAADGAAGTLLKTNGAGQLSFTALSTSDIPSLDTAKITTGTLPVARGGTGLTSYGNNSVLVSNGTGLGISSLNCTLGEVIKFDVSGFAGCGTDSTGSGSQWTTTGSDIYYTSGNVGIGTTTPPRMLSVNGTAQIGNTNSAYGFAYLTINRSTALDGKYNLFLDDKEYGANTQANLIFATGGASRGFIIGGQDASANRYLSIGTTSEAMRIDSTGNVGIGTTNPSSILEVAGNFILSKDADRSILVGNSTTDGVNAGSLTLYAASNTGNTTANGGSVNIGAGSGKLAGSGGSVTITGGQGGLTGANSGSVNILGGNANTTGGNAGGSVSISAGMGLGATNPGGNLSLSGGSASVLNNNGGSVYINAGSKSGSGTNGSIILGNNAGNVGIGTTSPASRLVVSENSATLPTLATPSVARFVAADSSSSRLGIETYGSGAIAPTLRLVRAQGTAAAPTAILQSDYLGQVAVGGYTGAGYNHTSAGMVAMARENWSASANGSFIYFYTTQSGGTTTGGRFVIQNDGSMGFGGSITDSWSFAGAAMVLDSSGRLGIGVTNPGTKLQVAGVITPSADNTYTLGDATHRFTDVYSMNAANNTSDIREKKQIQDSDLGLDFVLKLRPVSYLWKKGSDGNQHYGLLAQDTEKAIADSKNQPADNEKPIIVTYDKQSDRYGIRYTELISPIIKAIHELFLKVMNAENENQTQNRQIASKADKADVELLLTENASLKAAIEKQERENAAMKTRLENLEKAHNQR